MERTYIMVKVCVGGGRGEGGGGAWRVRSPDRLTVCLSLCLPAAQPDGVQRGLVGEIIRRFEAKGFKLAALKLIQPTKELLETHYADLKGRSFFNGLVTYMLSGPVVGMVWVGRGAVKTGRVMLGTTNPADSAPGTIRGDFAIEVGMNICHGSDSVEAGTAWG
jgi:nucleoside-diphosphate kinase